MIMCRDYGCIAECYYVPEKCLLNTPFLVTVQSSGGN